MATWNWLKLCKTYWKIWKTCSLVQTRSGCFKKTQCFHQFFVTFADLWIKITSYAESNSAVFTDNLSDSARRLSFLARVQQVYLELNVIIWWTLLMITKSKSRLDLAYQGSSRVRGRQKKMRNPHGYEFTFVNLSLSRLCKCYLQYGNKLLLITTCCM